jgi:hypothetical protein
MKSVLRISFGPWPVERAGAKIIGDDVKPRRIPLSDRCIEILKALPKEDGNKHLFIGRQERSWLISGGHIRTDDGDEV